ncbi:CPSF A subunit region-domain-containing protein [Lipomyces japonicus]|uniref:CPSF A subunit region-domain-containing protein n=1 Tax=Lipomyces japonicus TaxID=56871 RepID=UPI0034CEDA6C
MSAVSTSMHLYSLTLLPPTAITASIIGQFSGERHQEIILARGTRLELYRTDAAAGRLTPVFSTDVFGIIRTIVAFRVAGSSKDHIVIGTDAGRLAVLEYKPEQHNFVQVHLETFGKTGVRRVIPGQFLAVDPKGRATMIASVEKNKLVYILNRDSNANVTISSPLEAHRARSLLYHVIGLDVGYDNPIFAALEIDYSDAELDPSGRAYQEVQKTLTYYELDLGLNHVVRIWNEPVDRSANLLFAVPGGADGPSGVLVCSEGWIHYRHMNRATHRVPIPRRRTPLDDPNRKRIIISGVMHKMKGAFFLLLQTDEGDLFKVTIDYTVVAVQGVKIKYFDTVPLARSLNILKSGFLFVAAEGGTHNFYQFEKLGDDDNEAEFRSSTYEKGSVGDYAPAFFYPRPLQNLVLVDIVDSLNPLVDAKIANLTSEDAPQIYALAGQGARSTFRTIRHGLEVTELVASELPGDPTALWTTKRSSADEYDAYIVLSFVNGTLVLSIGETVEEVSDSGILSSTPTLAIQQVGADSLVQVYPKGIRHISGEKEINEWEAPLHEAIVAATTNDRQVAIALSTGEIVYFELDDEGQLNEYQDRKQMDAPVICLSVGDVPEGRVRNSFLAVGCQDSTIHIISLDPDNTLTSLSVQALTAPATSLRILSMPDNTFEDQSKPAVDASHTLYLHIGLNNGVYLRSILDGISGQLSDTQTQFLGPKPIKLFKVTMQGRPTILALSSRPWLGYTHSASYQVTPLVYESLEYGSGFTSEQCPEGIVGIEGSNLRIFTIERLTENIKQDVIPLTYTPRRLVQHFTQPIFYVIQSDANTLSPFQRQALISNSRNQSDYEELPTDEFGLPRAQGRWASCIEVISPLEQDKLLKIEFEDNEAAFSVAVCSFASYQRPEVDEDDDEERDEEEEEEEEYDEQGNPLPKTYVVVGTAKDVSLIPKRSTAGFLHVFRASADGKKLKFIHKTELPDVPVALTEFQNKLLVGMGGVLRLYDMGMKRLLRKAEFRSRNISNIVSIQTAHNRVIVADNQQSVTYLIYRHDDNRFLPVADDTIARHTTAITQLDYETVVGGDRFGNVWVVRCGDKVSHDADLDNGAGLLHARAYLDGAPSRLDTVAHYFVQDIPTSMHKTRLVPGGLEVVLFTGLQGTIGLLIPFLTKDDVVFFQQLESLMRTQDAPLSGRDHLIYRGQYVPVKSVIDGDLCERFITLPAEQKRSIAAELERTANEVERKISAIRTRYAF